MFAKIDMSDVKKKIDGVVNYGQGFLDAIRTSKSIVNLHIANAAVEALSDYIDAKAQASPETLHHVYEPGMTGRPEGRLFEFDIVPGPDIIEIKATFLESHNVPLNGGHPFRERAAVMESGATITIKPKDSDQLVFMDGGQLVFTAATITIEHPGGPDVEKSFADTCYAFFTGYATKSIIEPILRRFASPVEFNPGNNANFNAGRAAGMKNVRNSLETS